MPALEQKRWLTIGLALLSLAFLLSTGSYLYPASGGAAGSAQSGPYKVILAPANLQRTTRLESFETIYVRAFQRSFPEQCSSYTQTTNEWGSEESISGKGSTMKYTARARTLIGWSIEKYGLRSMTDGPSGDAHCQWSRFTL